MAIKHPAHPYRILPDDKYAVLQKRPEVTTTSEGAFKVFVENNLAFSIFVVMIVPIFIYILLAFFVQWSTSMNAFLLGKFKRPLPDNPELYYDINCINSMTAEDFLNSNQIQRCREMRQINRPGPPLGRK